MPLVSTIINTFNHGRFIARAVDSALSQDFKDFEIIVVDADSTDDTPAIINSRFAGKVRYIRLGERVNQSGGRNAGIQAACGRYLAFLDSDDAWHPSKLRRQLEVMSAGGQALGMVYCRMLVADASGIRTDAPPPPLRGRPLDRLLEQNFFCGAASSALMKRECLGEETWFDESLWASEDWDLWIRLLERCDVDFVDEPLITRYEHGGNVSRSLENLFAGRELILRKHAALYAQRPKVLSLCCYVAGLQALQLGRRKAARSYFLRAFRAAAAAGFPLRALKSLARAAWA